MVAYVNANGVLASIIYFDNDNKRSKQIDLTHPHNGMQPHVHRGYYHNEYTAKGQPTNLTTQERALLDRIIVFWNNRKSG